MSQRLIADRIGVIGDVHCEDAYLALAIRTLHAEGLTTIVCTGDIPSGPGDINACCRLLHQHSIPTIRGNHDRWLLTLDLISVPWATPPSIVTKASWRFLESLPVSMDLQSTDGLVLLCHGIGAEDMISILPEQPNLELDDHPYLQPIIESRRYKWMVNGHSHHRMARRYGPLAIVNAGTLRRDHSPCFAAIDFGNKLVTFWDILDQQTALRSPSISLS